MFVLKRRSLIPAPRRSSRTILPAAAGGVLLALLMVQLAWPRPIVLPPPGPIAPLRLDAVAVPPVRAAPVITARPLLAPTRGAATLAGAGGGTDLPLDGAVPVGLVTRRGRVLAFVQAPGGGATAIAPGETYHGWQVVRIASSGLVVRRDATVVTVPLAPSPGAGVVSVPGQPVVPR